MTRPETSLEALERDLQIALQWEPSAAARRQMISRVAGLGAQEGAKRGRWTWPRRRMLVLAGAGLLLMGAASAVTLLQQAVSLDPRWQAAYDHAERVNLTQTIDGYTVTIERAYADSHNLVLAVSLAGPGNTFPALPQVIVTDSTGRQYAEIGSWSAGDSASGSTGTIWAYEVPPGAASPLQVTATVEPLMSRPVTDLSSPPAWVSGTQEPAVPAGLVGPWTFHLKLQLQQP